MTQCYKIFEEFPGTYYGILMSWLLMEKDVILQTGLSMLHRWRGRDERSCFVILRVFSVPKSDFMFILMLWFCSLTRN